MTAHHMPTLTPAETLAALNAWIAARPEPRKPVHPETYCPCVRSVERDDWLESRAEDRAAEARGDHWSERDRGQLADWRAGS